MDNVWLSRIHSYSSLYRAFIFSTSLSYANGSVKTLEQKKITHPPYFSIVFLHSLFVDQQHALCFHRHHGLWAQLHPPDSRWKHKHSSDCPCHQGCTKAPYTQHPSCPVFARQCFSQHKGKYYWCDTATTTRHIPHSFLFQLFFGPSHVDMAGCGAAPYLPFLLPDPYPPGFVCCNRSLLDWRGIIRSWRILYCNMAIYPCWSPIAFFPFLSLQLAPQRSQATQNFAARLWRCQHTSLYNLLLHYCSIQAIVDGDENPCEIHYNRFVVLAWFSLQHTGLFVFGPIENIGLACAAYPFFPFLCWEKIRALIYSCYFWPFGTYCYQESLISYFAILR